MYTYDMLLALCDVIFDLIKGFKVSKIKKYFTSGLDLPNINTVAKQLSGIFEYPTYELLKYPKPTKIICG